MGHEYEVVAVEDKPWSSGNGGGGKTGLTTRIRRDSGNQNRISRNGSGLDDDISGGEHGEFVSNHGRSLNGGRVGYNNNNKNDDDGGGGGESCSLAREASAHLVEISFLDDESLRGEGDSFDVEWGDDGSDDDEGGDSRSMRSRMNSTADEIIVDSFNDHYEDGWRMKALSTVLQAFIVIILIGLLFWGVKQMFPDVQDSIRDWGTWANNVGVMGTFAFALVAGVLMLIPGVPGSLLCFTCGTVFPFGRALFVAAVGHHLGACLAFAIARCACRTRFEKLLLSRPTLRTMSIAAQIEQWKVTFLSRFIVMPVQIKNYLFGVLPVTFRCFFFMAFLGDFQSTLFSVYLGSLSQHVLENVGKNSDSQRDGGLIELDSGFGSSGDIDSNAFSSFLPIASLFVAVAMTTVASIVARKAYLQVLSEIKSEESQNRGKTRVRRRRRSKPSSFRSTLG